MSSTNCVQLYKQAHRGGAECKRQSDNKKQEKKEEWRRNDCRVYTTRW